MKIVKVKNDRVFYNLNDIKELVEEQGFKDFEIGESPLLLGEELPIEDESLDLDTEYLCHTGILGEDDSIFYSMITTDYNENLNTRYRPIMLVKEDEENGEWIPLVKFEG